MSVVNKMLQDLESRQHEPVASADYQPPGKKSVLPRVILISVLVIAGVYALYYFGVFDPLLAQQSANQSSPAVSSNDRQKAELATVQAEPVTEEAQAATVVQATNVVNKPSADQASEQPLETAQENHDENIGTLSDVSTISDVASPSEAVPVVEQIPDPDEAEEPVAEPIFELSSSSSATPKRSLKQRVQDALETGDSVEATRLLSQLLELEPLNQPARKKLAALLFAQKQQKSAESLLLEGLELHPQSAQLRLMLARLYSQNKQLNQAFDLLSAYSPSAMSEPDYLAFRASLAEQMNRFSSARTDYYQLAAAFPDNAKWWLGLAVTLERLGESNAASQAYRNAYELNQLSLEVTNFVRQRLSFLEASQ